MKQRARIIALPVWVNSCRTLLFFTAAAWILFSSTGCQTLRRGSGYDQESKYSLKKRKSYISCIPDAGGSPVTRSLPLKVSERSIKRLFSSIDDHLGARYRPGGTTPDGFDCSGFVQYLYKNNFRMLLPRTSGELAVLGTMVKKPQLQPGDLVFFSIDGNKIDHVGIYIGEKSFAHAATGGVKVNNIDEHYFFSRYAFATRLITTD